MHFSYFQEEKYIPGAPPSNRIACAEGKRGPLTLSAGRGWVGDEHGEGAGTAAPEPPARTEALDPEANLNLT